jgi:hypothetical protein
MTLLTKLSKCVVAAGTACALCLPPLVATIGSMTVTAATQAADAHGRAAVVSGNKPPLGLPPRNCGSSPSPRVISPYFNRGFGSAPVWAVSWFVNGPIFHVGSPSWVTYTKFGWTAKVLWVVQPGYLHHVTLHGGNLRTHTPLWFQIGMNAPSTAPTLDPRKPGIPIQHGNWREFPSYLFIPRSGCYYLQATWPGGSWRRVFGAGR